MNALTCFFQFVSYYARFILVASLWAFYATFGCFKINKKLLYLIKCDEVGEKEEEEKDEGKGEEVQEEEEEFQEEEQDMEVEDGDNRK